VKRILVSAAPLLSGLLFGLGLMLSGMTQPAKVQGFLDVGGLWDPSLALVMAGAIAVALPFFQWSMRRDAADPRVSRPIDRQLVIGSLLFGVGWGLSGYCPGPALVMAGSGAGEALLYVVAMGVGMLAGNRFIGPSGPGGQNRQERT